MHCRDTGVGVFSKSFTEFSGNVSCKKGYSNLQPSVEETTELARHRYGRGSCFSDLSNSLNSLNSPFILGKLHSSHQKVSFREKNLKENTLRKVSAPTMSLPFQHLSQQYCPLPSSSACWQFPYGGGSSLNE